MSDEIHVITFDGIKAGEINVPEFEIKVPENALSQVKTLVSATYDAAKALKTSNDETSALQAKYDDLENSNKELQEKHDSLEKGNPDQRKTEIKERLGLERTAAFFKIDKAGEMEDSDLMKAVILSKHSEVNLDGKGEAYIKARFDILAEEAAKGATGLEQLQAISQAVVPRGDNIEEFIGGQQKPPQKTREDFADAMRNAFKTPPGSILPPVPQVTVVKQTL